MVHVWLRNSAGEYLLTRRSPNKGYGGLWESPGGAARAGDDSLSACLREIKEETGLSLEPDRGRIVKSYRGDRYFCDVWLFRQDFSLEDCGAPGRGDLRLHAGLCPGGPGTAQAGLFVPFLDLDHLLDEQ